MGRPITVRVPLPLALLAPVEHGPMAAEQSRLSDVVTGVGPLEEEGVGHVGTLRDVMGHGRIQAAQVWV
jgi:hypothetical protein